jgi:hypothetical protein
VRPIFYDGFSTGSSKRYLVTRNRGVPIHCLDCLQPKISVQYRECVFNAHSFVFCRTTEGDNGRIGSGLQNLVPEPSLASSSAFSLPSISQCPGTQISFTPLDIIFSGLTESVRKFWCGDPLFSETFYSFSAL